MATFKIQYKSIGKSCDPGQCVKICGIDVRNIMTCKK